MLQAIEIGIILLLISWQAVVYGKNQRLIRQVAAMYPTNSTLSVQEVFTPHLPVDALVPPAGELSHFDMICQGKASFRWPAKSPNGEYIINGKDADGKYKVQKLNSYNQWQENGIIEYHFLKKYVADDVITFLKEYSAALHTTPKKRKEKEYDAICVENSSPQFAQVLADTNDYLQANKGAAAAFDTLRDISEREANLLDEEIQAQISTPLYLGLLGTFGGAILGLVALVNPFAHANTQAGASFDDGDVKKFLGGVLIAMVGSIFGLGFTLAGNQQLKTARTTRDQLKNGYYNFLQKSLLPRLNSDMQQSMSSLKAVLDTFNQDFFSKIQTGFFAKVAEFTPLVGAITENITVQRDFLAKLQTIGYTQLANSTIRVFDRVDESAATFEKFLGYQQALNVAVGKGAETVTTITALLNRLTTIEQALNTVPGYLQQQQQSIGEQAEFFRKYNGLFDQIAQGVTQALSEDASKMQQVLERKRNQLDQEAQAAHAEWQAHFQRLNDNNVYQRITDYLTPFQQLPAQQQQLNRLQEEQARRSAAALTALQERIGRDEQIQRELLAQLDRTNTVLEKITEPNWFQRTILGKKGRAPH